MIKYGLDLKDQPIEEYCWITLDQNELKATFERQKLNVTSATQILLKNKINVFDDLVFKRRSATMRQLVDASKNIKNLDKQKIREHFYHIIKSNKVSNKFIEIWENEVKTKNDLQKLEKNIE